jgi:hypothetical protein
MARPVLDALGGEPVAGVVAGVVRSAASSTSTASSSL